MYKKFLRTSLVVGSILGTMIAVSSDGVAAARDICYDDLKARKLPNATVSQYEVGHTLDTALSQQDDPEAWEDKRIYEVDNPNTAKRMYWDNPPQGLNPVTRGEKRDHAQG